MAVPLFIFAATVCRFVGDYRRRNPRTRLQTVLDHGHRSHGSQLEQTYAPILCSQITELPKGGREEVIKDFKVIVGSIVTLASPLSVTALSRLIDILPDTVDERLDALHSVLSIPLERTMPVRLLHLSFRDYLIDPENKETVEFWVDEKLAHQRLARHCLRVMRSALRKNMCGLPFPGMRRSAVGVRQLEEHVPPELQYACMNLVYHQTKVDLEPDDSSDIYDFLKTHLLHWLEALSLMGRISESIGFIDELQSIVDPKKGAQVLSFLRDAKRFVLNFRWIIDTAPLQLYASAIVFAPKQSIMRQTFERYLPRWISPLPNVESDWNAVLQTLEGHKHSVSSVVFSNDGKLIASGSYDGTVKIWNITTGEKERTLEGHRGRVSSGVFSNDGTLVTSGSEDETAKRPVFFAGRPVSNLEDFRRRVISVVFSNDGIFIASGSIDETVKIWNVATGKEELILKGHRGGINSIVFSKDSKLIASGSDDKTVKVWDVAMGINIRRIGTGKTTDVLSFTDDDSVLVTSTGRFILRFRDTKTSHSSESDLKLGSTEVQGEVDARLGFGINRDNTRITAGGPDGRKVLWLPPDFRPGVSATLTRHSGSVVVTGWCGSSVSSLLL
ncbi:Vegetative incompatibility protein HET-E-1 [Fusarium oxysporum f. sp. rapae]|uniref:Vegetative incompatibility protein HET-E-1 n=1 Tax=Fusarium oxysporum f. sp. rapae TaxID=485398 RepID=A0A8J5NEC8_FUSOX|nr:Vegetative incompatibility protein HET-E-1 [Fusarium oxysporum f. sp. rapae]